MVLLSTGGIGQDTGNLCNQRATVAETCPSINVPPPGNALLPASHGFLIDATQRARLRLCNDSLPEIRSACTHTCTTVRGDQPRCEVAENSRRPPLCPRQSRKIGRKTDAILKLSKQHDTMINEAVEAKSEAVGKQLYGVRPNEPNC